MRAFSLVELSIVLVILGLLTGGILAGQSLIRAAELRKVSTQSNRYITSVYTFRDKYMALPGDMPNAVRFWGAQTGALTDGVDNTCRDLTTAATGTATCNGDGSGLVGGNSATRYFERFRFWQHLANAGLIEGQYSGIAGPHVNREEPVIGTNVPAALDATTGYYITYSPQHGDFYNTLNGHLITLGKRTDVWTLGAGAFSPEEVWGVDVKMDDGSPAYGRVQHRAQASGDQSPCVTSLSAATANYALTNGSKNCSIIFSPDFKMVVGYATAR